MLTLMKGDKGVEFFKNLSNFFLLYFAGWNWNIKLRQITSAYSLSCSSCKTSIYRIKIRL